MRLALFRARVPRWVLPAVWILFGCYLLAVLAAAHLFDRRTEALVRQRIDHELRIAVSLAQAAFPDGLRARAESGPPLDAAEDRRLARLADRLCGDSGIAYLYALYADAAGTVRHLWTSDQDRELADDRPETWFGRPYEDCPDAARRAIAEGGGLHYATYTDRWGAFRGCYLGRRDAQGLAFAIGADVALEEVEATLAANRRNVAIAAGASALAGLGLGIGLHLLIRRLQRAQRDLALLAAVAQGSGHAVLLSDPDGVVRWANPACERHLGVAAVGLRLDGLVAGDAAFAAAVQRARGGSGASCEVAGPGGARAAWLAADLRPVDNPGGAPWVVCLMRDLSRDRAVQDELRRAREQAERVAAAKSAFLANMSHEIRTPLNGILGLTGLLLERDLPPADRELVQAAHGSGEVLLRLLGDILDLTKIEAQAMPIDPRPCDLGAVVRDAVQLFRPAAEAKGLEIACAGEALWVVADAVRLRQVLGNLVSNAVKFTDAGSIAVTLRAEDAGGQRRVRIAVADTGIGIPRDRQGELFQPFVQVDDSMTRRAGGTGLGLAISRRLVGLMGGTLTLESEPGAGSTFTVEVVLPPARAPSGRVAAQRAQPRSGRVLVAAAKRTDRTVAGLQLRAQGVRDIEQAEDAQSAIAAAMAGPCAMVLLDLALPGGAAAVAAALRAADGASRSTAIIALLGGGDGAPSGFDGGLARPVSAEALRPMLDRWCPVG